MGEASGSSASTVSRLLAGVAILCILRAAAAAVLPLSADEAYYWLWSRHLASGYFDHPPAIAFLIRGGTVLLGATTAGVRAGSLVASLIATFFVWRSAVLFLGREEDGARAALYFNLTLMVSAESLAATPDAPEIACSAAFLYALLRLETGGDSRWWPLAGVAGGFALLSKYTALFLGLGTGLWLVATPEGRSWLKTVWPYAGGILAALVFSPNLLWNSEHHWQTFVFQFARVGSGEFTPRFLAEFLLAQIGLASPFILLLTLRGAATAWMERRQRLAAFLILPAIAYFLIHALHDRVQANWTSFLFPALSILAAVAANTPQETRAPVTRVAQRLAIPVAVFLLAITYAQAFFAVVPAGRGDPLSRLLGFGIGDVAQRAEALRGQSGAAGLVTTDYATAAWLLFYSGTRVPILVFGDDRRWTFADLAPAKLVARPLLYVAEDRHDVRQALSSGFEQVVLLGSIERERGGVRIARYVVYRLNGSRAGHVSLRAP